jgi:16S rRNA (cytosine967-C5)-methyltransferase
MAQKLGIDIIKAVEHDSTVTEPNLEGLADRVICDVPCSGLGVLSKKADLRLRDENLNEDLPNLQYQILCASSKYLKVGGVLIYSTCTLRSVENEDVVTRFVKENPNYILEDFTVTNDLFSCNGMLNLFPHKHETDGFFIAKIKRIS